MTSTKLLVSDEHIHQSNLIEGFDSQEADDCLKRAWDYLKDKEKINLGDIRKAQKLATLHQKDMMPHWRGYFRDKSNQGVFIAGREALKPVFVPKAMDNLISIIDFTHPRTWHVEFEKIHPFVDGNGRTGRLIMWWMEIKRGTKPTLIKYDERQKYYTWFK